ncbi:hypothetical protein HanHA300_Chr04g0115691 [Helianthus annuus]|uniref:Secreted protein n=1 Tax=Helianthus annuus TaxID=4232 RepID=A0A251UUD6_HELAN|nr:hypothetical protein HanHA300_Chr04g0115691 [Helianthus annuus]
MCVFLTTFFTFSFGCDAGKHQQAFELAGGFAPLKCFDDFKRTGTEWTSSAHIITVVIPLPCCHWYMPSRSWFDRRTDGSVTVV